MPFTSEQIEELKKQLAEQVDKSPNENKEEIKEYIKNLNENQLEEFLKQNKIQVSGSNQGLDQSVREKPIFESIVRNEMPSYKIGENNKSIAILEINPLSKAHSLVLPKEKTTIEKIPKTAFALAQKIAKKIKTKFKPKDIKIETFSFQDYPAINIIPIYKDMPLKKERAKEEDLHELQKKLETKKLFSSRKTSKKKLSKNLPEISFRIP